LTIENTGGEAQSIAFTGLDREIPAIPGPVARADISQGPGRPLGEMDRQYLDFTAIDIERAMGATYSLEPAFCEPSRGSIDRDGE